MGEFWHLQLSFTVVELPPNVVDDFVLAVEDLVDVPTSDALFVDDDNLDEVDTFDEET
jgi:hypothetical protein